MGKQLSFAVALNLLTTGFTKGANKANGALRSIQLQVRNLSMAFAAGAIGIGNFTSQIMISVKGMAKATQTLKNVTGDSYSYSNALKFVNEQSKKYNQELIGLTGNYAKFYAAARGSNMSLKDTQNVFDALTQSSTYFNLSADETSGVMLAVTQMMSKGKITAEELRGQLGERLPSAIQIMARALNITTAQLDDMMKKGKLVASEVLPLFGQQLKLETMNFNPNSIEGSINKLRNTITELFATDKMQKLMSGVINTITKAFEVVANNIKNISAGIWSAIAMSGSVMFSKMVQKHNLDLAQLTNKYGGLREKFNSINSKISSPIVTTDNLGDDFTKLTNLTKKQADAVHTLATKYNLLEEQARISFGKSIEDVVKMEENLGRTEIATSRVVAGFKRIGASIKSFLISNWITIAVAGLTFLITKIAQAIKEANRLRNIPFESQRNIKTVEKSYSAGGAGYIQEKAKLEAIRTMYLDINTTIAKRKQLLEMLGVPTNKVNGYTSEQLKSEDLINSAINERLKLIKEEAILRAKAQEYTRILARKEELNTEIAKTSSGLTTAEIVFESVSPNNPFSQKLKDIQAYKKEIAALDAVLANKGAEFENAFRELEKRRIEGDNTGGSSSENDIIILQKYAKERKELDNQIKNGAISQKEYYDEVLKLTDSFLKQIGILDKVEGKYKELFYTLMEENLGLKDLEIEIEDPEIKVDTDKFQEKLEKDLAKDLYIPIRPEARDKTFDYKKSVAQRLEDEVEIAQKLKEELKKAVESGLSNYKLELEVAIKGEKDLSKALKLAQVQEDIKGIQEQLNESAFSSIKDVATSVERLVDAFNNVKETFEDIDASGFEKVMAVINALIQTIDSISSVANGIQALTELTNKLTLAKEAETTVIATKGATEVEALTAVATAQTAATSAEVAGITTVTTAKAGAAAAEAPIMIAQMALAKTAAGVYGGLMAAQSAAAYASIPFAGVALAAGQIAAMEAMIIAASVPKFADGGIVSGATIGMVGEYAGASTNPEVIAPLNKLKSLLKLDEKTGSSEVTFRIKGDTLVGVLNNYDKKKSKVR